MKKDQLMKTIRKQYPTASDDKVKLVAASILDANVATADVPRFIDTLMNFKSSVSNIGQSLESCVKCKQPTQVVKVDENRLADYCPLCRITLPKPVM